MASLIRAAMQRLAPALALFLPPVAAAVDPHLVKNATLRYLPSVAAAAVDPRLVKNATLRYLSGGVHPVLDGSTPGMVPKRGNATLGIEDGTIVVVDGVMASAYAVGREQGCK